MQCLPPNGVMQLEVENCCLAVPLLRTDIINKETTGNTKTDLTPPLLKSYCQMVDGRTDIVNIGNLPCKTFSLYGGDTWTITTIHMIR